MAVNRTVRDMDRYGQHEIDFSLAVGYWKVYFYYLRSYKVAAFDLMEKLNTDS